MDTLTTHAEAMTLEDVPAPSLKQHQWIVQIALDTPLLPPLDYIWEDQIPPQIGFLVLVTLGRRPMIGLVVSIQTTSILPIEKLKPVLAIRDQIPPLSKEWLALCQFAALYYQRSLGEVILPALPKNCRAIKTVALDKALKKMHAIVPQEERLSVDEKMHAGFVLNTEQEQAVTKIVSTQTFQCHVLFGITGSGKTEVYLHTAKHILSQDKESQILILVPEINLTPAFLNHLKKRFPEWMIAMLHSGMSESERTAHWLAAHMGRAQLILGTRLAIFASLPHLRLIIIDEEHDISYKQQEGLRYSARDLAVWRGRQLNIPVVLGSATPSLETWFHMQSGRYHALILKNRAIKAASLPEIKLIDLNQHACQLGLTSILLEAIQIRLERKEQSLLYLNRRGYAPVLTCESCGWVSQCNHCSAYLVLHKTEKKLRCHHCGYAVFIPSACPTCGNVDIAPFGRGTQRIEEALQMHFQHARICRIDADSTRQKGSAQKAFDAIHDGEVDILIGTQMVAKGHDFKHLTLVGIINPDNALFTQDYRASERLFAQLMQVSGRAGRSGKQLGLSEVWVQTRHPTHPLYQALCAHDYPYFAQTCLAQRQQAQLPPFIYQALLRAEARQLDTALLFLTRAVALAQGAEKITLHDPIPMSLVKLANKERAQLLIESSSRQALHTFLKKWLPLLQTVKLSVNWLLEVDPVNI